MQMKINELFWTYERSCEHENVKHKRLQKIKMNVKKSISYIFLEESVVYDLE